MSWLPERQQRSWLQQLCESILKTGPVPEHIAIIMDGNRRFAVKKSIDRAEGHLQGFQKLAETLDWCLRLGLREVTVYAFSIENFKRSKEEVECLMELAKQKLARLLQEKELIQKHEVCIRVLGKIELLSPELQQMIADAVLFSKNNKRATLNVCFAYTARDDISNAMKELALGVKAGEIQESDITDSLLEKCLYSSHCRPVDLLIRTSGEVRLSDFQLWESAYSCLAFVNVLWPEFSIWHLYAAILHYQRNYAQIQIARQNRDIERERLQRDSDYNCVLKEISHHNPDSATVQESVQKYAADRASRIDAFLQRLYEKRGSLLEKLIPGSIQCPMISLLS
ncbi:dehydrodolichyl diphosphate synthase complex subunit DHDDS-like [Pomacea canaliculata]|uniref:dehydrodolichyl diphosphate synthase complex subunit DHDDS-like n=1 Tax=Pomacea canaliculata TaxID=400727 RepID=UPI000D73F31B|nr:dehydrodolichyl diphosphate synthase complex subunit DHDDS-like [Pomacea canaliculata]